MSIPTEEQQAIYDYIRAKRKHIGVRALAGSGKTTTAVAAAKCVSSEKNVGFVAFNKHIAAELQHRLGLSARAATLHSVGFSTLRSKIPGVGEVDAKKYFKILKELYPQAFDHREKLHRNFSGISKLIDIFRNELASFEDVDAKAVRKQIVAAADLQGWEFPASMSSFDEMLAMTTNIVKTGLEKMQTVDYTDMVSAPSYLGFVGHQYDFLIADEAQDFNCAQQQLVMKLSPRIMFVGDPHQSIMLFAGADAESFNTLRRELNATEFPLSTCWRCPSSHLNLARYLVPEIRNRPDAPTGVYEETVEAALPRMVKPGDLVICRANAPLVSLTYQLISNNVSATIRGRSIGEGLTNLIKKLFPTSIQDLIRKLKNYQQVNLDKLIARDASDSVIQAHNDQCNCILILANSNENVGELMEAIDRMFADDIDESKKVILSSIHRSKGSEANNVYILHPHILGRKGGNEESTIQEMNLAYVALTRSKHRLVLAEGAKSKRPETSEWLRQMSRSGQEG
jgi:DNA helicase-2/ATP-dependent DNA helicase PcrA